MVLVTELKRTFSLSFALYLYVYNHGQTVHDGTGPYTPNYLIPVVTTTSTLSLSGCHCKQLENEPRTRKLAANGTIGNIVARH